MNNLDKQALAREWNSGWEKGFQCGQDRMIDFVEEEIDRLRESLNHNQLVNRHSNWLGYEGRNIEEAVCAEVERRVANPEHRQVIRLRVRDAMCLAWRAGLVAGRAERSPAGEEVKNGE